MPAGWTDTLCGMTPPDRERVPDTSHVVYGTSGDDRRLLPSLSVAEWFVFALMAAVLAAANIYTTLLIGWGDTGSIVAVLASVLLLGVITTHVPSVHHLNLGQTMASAGGSVGFAIASYAAVYIADPEFRPSTGRMIVMFACMGMVGTLVGSSVRKAMVKYFFPSGTVCAVIQTAVARRLEPGERNRPVWLLTVWGSIAALITIPTKITFTRGDHALVRDLQVNDRIGLGVDPLYYGIGIVVGPRIGLGMLIGALAVPYLITDGLAGTALEPETGDWVRWMAIAVLTLPTFAAIGFAYMYKTPPVIPAGFEPGRTTYGVPGHRRLAYGLVSLAAAVGVVLLGQQVFDMPWHVSAVVIAIAWPLCLVNGRVAGDTDINPVRLVAIVLLSAFFWMLAGKDAIAMLGMAVIGGTLASVAVDMFQDYRTGYLVDANPTHQTSVQFFGVVLGALAGIPILEMLVDQLSIGPGSSLPAPGAQVWSAMAVAAAGGFDPSNQLIAGIAIASAVGCLYAFFTVWPKSAPYMPSLFGIGIGMLVGVPAAAAIFAGGLIKWVATLVATSGKQGAEREAAQERATNDTMLAGASIFAAGAILSILLVIATTVFDAFGLDLFHIAH